ncbi:MAG TPA: 23S rRNA (uracil(1939)-C(5))-methyltransferase RlmD [Terriglobales bacterium]|nr:23S rRNA (uracil(1939)-C(5))-methyltransferase RlmD [Terriglobales bacterium]
MQLNIEKLVYGGEGLARLPADDCGPGKAALIPFVLPGEKIEATIVEQKPGFVRARTNAILEPSPRRLEPRCPYFQHCGGCHYQHTGYDHQLEIKAAILKENLRRIAKLELQQELKVHPSPPWNYRNRTRLKAQAVPEFALGYYKLNSHELLPVEECPISSPAINRAIGALWQMGRARKVPAGIQEIEFFANADDTQLLAEVYASPEIAGVTEPLVAAMQAAVPEICGALFFEARPSKVESQVDFCSFTARGETRISYQTKLASYRVSAGSFFQVNRYLSDELVDIVTANRAGNTALDLYAGVGLFASVLNREFQRVLAVESSPTSYADLLYNSPANVKAVRATTEQYLENAAGKLQPDLIVVDPPRSGLGEKVIQGLAKMKAPRITYVACDPATFSRDLVRLLASGYRVDDAHLLDMFPQTYHIESVFQLVK